MVERSVNPSLWVSLLSTGSLFLLELVFSGGFPTGLPWLVFSFLALMAFIATSSLYEGFRRFGESKVQALGSILVGIFAVVAWVTLFLDQLPCFLGGKGC